MFFRSLRYSPSNRVREYAPLLERSQEEFEAPGEEENGRHARHWRVMFGSMTGQVLRTVHPPLRFHHRPKKQSLCHFSSICFIYIFQAMTPRTAPQNCALWSFCSIFAHRLYHKKAPAEAGAIEPSIIFIELEQAADLTGGRIDVDAAEGRVGAGARHQADRSGAGAQELGARVNEHVADRHPPLRPPS